MNYELIFVIKEEKKDLLSMFLKYVWVGGWVGIVICFLDQMFFDIISDTLFYICFGCAFVPRILINMMEIEFKKDIGKVSLCANGSILLTTKEVEWSLEKSEVQEVVIYFHHSYNGCGTDWYSRSVVLLGDGNTIKITSKSGQVFNYFFLSKYKEDLEYITELVNEWQTLGINVVLTKNEKYNKKS